MLLFKSMLKLAEKTNFMTKLAAQEKAK